MKKGKCPYNLREMERQTGINHSTLSRRWHSPNSLLLYEIEAIAKYLGMTDEQVIKKWKEG